MNVSLPANETKVRLSNLQGERKYLYTVSATNEIGASNPSEEKTLSKEKL